MVRLVNDRPSAGEVNRVPAKELLTVREPNRRTQVVVVEDRAEFRVVEHTLSTRSIHIVVAFQNQSASVLSAGLASLVNLESLLAWMSSSSTYMEKEKLTKPPLGF